MNTKMTPKPWPEEEQKASRERCENATEGPWTHQLCSSGAEILAQESDGEEFMIATVYSLNSDEKFVAHSRTDLPAAHAHIAWQAEQLERAQAQFAAIRNTLSAERALVLKAYALYAEALGEEKE